MSRKPVVGVSFAGPPWAKPEKEAFYLGCLERAGAEPLVVRPGCEKGIPDLLRSVSGWMFTGGDDIAPELYGEEPHPTLRTGDAGRDRLDLLLARAVLAGGTPCLGICLGVQVLNVAAGGSLVQDIPSMVPGALPHADGARHRVALEPGSRLAGIVGAAEVEVNSHHHQGVKRVGRGFRVAARSPDGVIEALERDGPVFQVGVQWHPERPGCAAGASEGLFAAFVAAAAGRIPLRAPAAS
jgi:putative glutamine amidotransferase